MKTILYVATHKPSGAWDFIRLPEDQPQGLAQGALLEKQSERILHHYIEEAPSLPVDIRGVINQIEVTRIGYEEGGKMVLTSKVIYLEEE